MNHAALINLGQALGYQKITAAGMCHGFSMMWIQAICNKDLNSFNNRLNLLEKFSGKPENLIKEIERVRNAVKEKESLLNRLILLEKFTENPENLTKEIERVRNAVQEKKALDPTDLALLEIAEKFSGKPEDLAKEIERVRNAVKEQKPLDPTDLALLEIPAFFEGVSLYQSPLEHVDIFNVHLIQFEEAKVSKYTQPTSAVGKLHSKRTWGQYDQGALQAHFMELALKLKDKPDVAISFSSSNHTVSARYLGNNEFEFMDINFDTQADSAIIAKRVPFEKLGDALKEAFKTTVKDDGTLVMSTAVFASNPEQITNDKYNKEALQAHVRELALKLTEKPDLEISFSSSDQTVSARYVGNNEFEFIDTDFDKQADSAIIPKRVPIEKLGDELIEAFKSSVKEDGTLVMSTAVFASNPEQIANLTFTQPTNINKIDTLIADAQGVTLLHLAFIRDKELFNRIDINKVDVNQLTFQGRCALSYACSGSKELFDKLLSVSHINVNPPNSDFALPITEAIFAGRWDMAEKIIEHPTFSCKAKDNKGLTPLHVVSTKQGPEAVSIARQLIEKGVDVNANAQYYDGLSPLHTACSSRNTKMVQLFIDHGANINAKNSEGKSPLHFANDPEIINLLIAKGADCNARSLWNKTALDMACDNGNFNTISILLPHTNLTINDIQLDSPMFKAIQKCDPQTKKDFLIQGLKAYIKEHENKSFFANTLSSFGLEFQDNKIRAAQELLNCLNNPQNNKLKSFLPDLTDGRLSVLYHFYEKNKAELNITPEPNITLTMRETVKEMKGADINTSLLDKTSDPKF